MKCPFCAFEAEDGVLVCRGCSRDILAPPSLIAERDDLVRKLKEAREELSQTKEEIRNLKRRGEGGD